MFTGIVEALGRVLSLEKSGISGKISITADLDLSAFNIGDSISVNGACLTVVRLFTGGFDADVTEETLSATTLGALKPEAPVNLERALTLATPLGGHLVTGHVDGPGRFVKRSARGAGQEMEFAADRKLIRQLVKKGSVAVDGISLTVASLTESAFRVAVIPHTLSATTLGALTEGAEVNIETDIIGKYVERFLGATSGDGGVSEELLKDHGFIK